MKKAFGFVLTVLLAAFIVAGMSRWGHRSKMADSKPIDLPLHLQAGITAENLAEHIANLKSREREVLDEIRLLEIAQAILQDRYGRQEIEVEGRLRARQGLLHQELQEVEAEIQNCGQAEENLRDAWITKKKEIDQEARLLTGKAPVNAEKLAQRLRGTGATPVIPDWRYGSGQSKSQEEEK